MSERERFELLDIWNRLMHVKLAKSCMGLRLLIDDAAAEIARLRAATLADRSEQDFRLHGAGAVQEFAKLILHGDDKHRAWLMEAAKAWSDGRPLPKPTNADRLEQPVFWIDTVDCDGKEGPVYLYAAQSHADMTPLYAAPPSHPAPSEAEPWISVKDRLPTEHGTYLVAYTEDATERRFVGDDRWDGNWWIDTHTGEVDHWMPLPTAPALGDPKKEA